MKTLLGSIIALALVITSGPAKAELLKNVRVIGAVDLQATSARNVSDFSTRRNVAAVPTNGNDRISTMMTRVLAGLSWDLLDDVHARVTFRKNDRAWGNFLNAGQAGDGSQTLIGGPGANSDIGSNLYVQEANVKIDKLFGHIDTTLGRQFVGNPGDLIVYFGPKNVYGLYVTAIDALVAEASNDWMTFMGLAGKTAATTINAVTAGDTDVRGIDVGFKGLPVKVNAFIWNRLIHATGALGIPARTAVTGGLNDNLYVYGLKLKGEAAGGWINLVAALNGGTNRTMGPLPAANAINSANYIGKGFLADAGYKLDVGDVGGFTPWGTFGWGSGRHDTTSRHNEDFATIAPDFRPGVIYGRFNSNGWLLANGPVNVNTSYDGLGGASTAGLGNRIIWGGGLKYNVAAQQKLTLGASFWDFNYQYATRLGRNPPAAVGNRHIGSELDLQVDWAHSENVLLSAGWASFQPGGHIKEQIRAADATGSTGNNPVNMVFADIGIRF